MTYMHRAGDDQGADADRGNVRADLQLRGHRERRAPPARLLRRFSRRFRFGGLRLGRLGLLTAADLACGGSAPAFCSRVVQYSHARAIGRGLQLSRLGALRVRRRSARRSSPSDQRAQLDFGIGVRNRPCGTPARAASCRRASRRGGASAPSSAGRALCASERALLRLDHHQIGVAELVAAVPDRHHLAP